MKILISICGYKGENTSLAALYDEDESVLVVQKRLSAYREDRPADDFALVSNIDLPQADFQFKDEMLADAIRAYYMMTAQGALVIESSLQRYQPDNRIDEDRIDENGRKYRVSPDIDNGQIGVLAAVAFIESQRGVCSALSAAQELAEDFRILTI